MTRIGGFFFRARDLEALNRSHAEHLGVVQPTGSYDDPGWFPERGETEFTASSADSDAFGRRTKRGRSTFAYPTSTAWSSNCKAAGIDVQRHDREYPVAGSPSSRIQRPTASSSGSQRRLTRPRPRSRGALNDASGTRRQECLTRRESTAIDGDRRGDCSTPSHQKALVMGPFLSRREAQTCWIAPRRS